MSDILFDCQSQINEFLNRPYQGAFRERLKQLEIEMIVIAIELNSSPLNSLDRVSLTEEERQKEAIAFINGDLP